MGLVPTGVVRILRVVGGLLRRAGCVGIARATLCRWACCARYQSAWDERREDIGCDDGAGGLTGAAWAD